MKLTELKYTYLESHKKFLKIAYRFSLEDETPIKFEDKKETLDKIIRETYPGSMILSHENKINSNITVSDTLYLPKEYLLSSSRVNLIAPSTTQSKKILLHTNLDEIKLSENYILIIQRSLNIEEVKKLYDKLSPNLFSDHKVTLIKKEIEEIIKKNIENKLHLYN